MFATFASNSLRRVADSAHKFINAYSIRNQLQYSLVALGSFYILKMGVYVMTRKSYHVNEKGIVLLTGASSGIGRRTMEHLCLCGYTVVAGCLNVEEVESMRREAIPGVVPIILDVTRHSDCVSAVNFVREEMHRLQYPLIAIVNNAGVLFSGPAEFLPLEKARYMFECNFFGAADLIQQVLPLLRESCGRIINMSSFTGIAG